MNEIDWRQVLIDVVADISDFEGPYFFSVWRERLPAEEFERVKQAIVNRNGRGWAP